MLYYTGRREAAHRLGSGVRLLAPRSELAAELTI